MSDKQIATASEPKDLRGLLNSPAILARFESILGKKAQAFASSIISVSQSNEALQECDPISIISGAALAASLDLPIIGSLGQSALVPYDGKAQFQIMARGFVQLALRSGQYKTMNATEVREGELVSRNKMTGEVIFDADGKKSEKVIGYLFYFKLISNYEHYEYATVEECQAHGKKYSRSYSNPKGKWQTDFSSMALKTVVKRGLSKWGPLSTEMQTAIEMDQSAVTDDGKPEYIDAFTEKVEAPTEPIAGPTEAPAKEAQVVDPISFQVLKVIRMKTNPIQFRIETTEGKAMFTLHENVALMAKTALETRAHCRAMVTDKAGAIWVDSMEVGSPAKPAQQAEAF